MRNSSMKRGESYDQGTRQKYRDEGVAKAYHSEFKTFSLSLNNALVWLVSRAEMRAVAASLAQISEQIQTVIDVPCGTGKLLPLLCTKTGTVIAGDVSEQMMSLARQDTSERGLHPWFVALDATQLPFADDSFDALVCLRLLHRVPANVLETIVAELKRVSRRYVILSYGVRNNWQSVRLSVRRMLTGRRTVPFPITDRSMNDLVESHGWSVVARRRVMFGFSAQTILLIER